MSIHRLTPDSIAECHKLNDQERATLTSFSKAFPSATVEFISPDAAQRRRVAGQRLNDFCEAVTNQVMEMKNNIELLHAHRNADTLKKLNEWRKYDRKQFLGLLFPPDCGFINLRAIKRGAKEETERIRTEMVPAGDLKAVEAFIAQNVRDRDIYFGVAARIRPDGGGGLQNCGLVRALWCDIDFKDTPEAEARQRLEAFKPAADIIIHSGGGLHIYWTLDDPVDLRTSAKVFKLHLRAIAKQLGGDMACAEAVHILRLPGTTNFKYQPPREVRLVQSFRIPN